MGRGRNKNRQFAKTKTSRGPSLSSQEIAWSILRWSSLWRRGLSQKWSRCICFNTDEADEADRSDKSDKFDGFDRFDRFHKLELIENGGIRQSTFQSIQVKPVEHSYYGSSNRTPLDTF